MLLNIQQQFRSTAAWRPCGRQRACSTAVMSPPTSCTGMSSNSLRLTGSGECATCSSNHDTCSGKEGWIHIHVHVTTVYHLACYMGGEREHACMPLTWSTSACR